MKQTIPFQYRLVFLFLPVIRASWPICYDYKIANRTLCPARDNSGQYISGELSVCYHTVMWKEYFPPPTCRTDGCNSDSNSACCCGADSTKAINALDPNKVYDRSACNLTEAALAKTGDQRARAAAIASGCQKCGPALWGSWHETGGAAGSCETCHAEEGGNDGVGGLVIQTFGTGIIDAPDATTFGHVESMDYKLLQCPTRVKNLFLSLEKAVNEECDIKTYFVLRRCGNCWRTICEFHNQLHWYNGYKCAQDLFLRRMECYAAWYHKYCDCQVSIPSNDLAGDLWVTNCAKAQLFTLDINSGVYPICSTASSSFVCLTRIVLIGLVLSVSLIHSHQ